ncbi:MAG: hypothetical protein WD063_09130 [Pirellulales bacterium]
MNNAERYLIWLFAGAMATAAVAWIAFQIQQDGIAPAVLFPILVGAVLGAALAAIGRVVRLPGRRAAVIGAICWGLLAACAQDYIGHRYRLRLYDDDLGRRSPLAAAIAREGEMLPTFFDHLVLTWREGPVWWSLDCVLTAAAAAGTVTALATRKRADPKTLSPGGGRALQTPLSLGGRGQGEGD